jgi:hypothetical protein
MWNVECFACVPFISSMAIMRCGGCAHSRVEFDDTISTLALKWTVIRAMAL